METTPLLFHKTLGENKKRRSSFKMSGVVICVFNVDHPKMIGNHCTISHGGGVVLCEISGVVFGWSSCMRVRTMKRVVLPTLTICVYELQSPCPSTVNGMRYPLRRACVAAQQIHI